jgi:signal transduction histidine kinase/ActR/RegA family two-component response regulator
MQKKILIIEDSRTEALRARLILERAGYQVNIAASGKEGLFKAAADKPDLILVDTIMPQMSGYEACGRLKIDPQTRAIPVVMLAAGEDLASMPSGQEIENLISKPYDPGQLVGKVKELSNGHERVAIPSDGGDAQAEIKRLADELNRAKQAAEAAKRSQTDFLANMSHELRTPLHEIMGMIELIGGADLAEEPAQYLATAKASSNALLSLIGDVIEFSEMEAGQLGLDEKEFALAEPLERTAEIYAPRAADKGLQFSAMVSAQVPKLLIGDSKRLRQILSNLVANAIKFTDQGQVNVSVDADAIRDGEVELHFRISDTGIGIPEDRQELLFEPFQQADSSATRRYGGMGMGLAMAKQLVKIMGGRIWVESEAGMGSSFHFTVKLKRPVQVAAPKPMAAAVASAWPRSLNILVAEDSPTNQLIARTSLKKAGHTVTLATNGREAVAAYEKIRSVANGPQFDLVLMDVAMPEMDGLDATRAIREKEKVLGGHVVIVAMTAFATKEYHEKCLSSGMDAYVTKPVRIDELDKTLEPLMLKPPAAAPAAPATPDIPAAVDLAAALEVVDGDVDILREATAISLEEVPEQLVALQEAMARQDPKGVEAKAHRLKGVMGNIGGLVARQVAQSLETMGEKGQLTGGPDLVKSLGIEIDRVVAFYRDPSWEQRARETQGAING